MKNRQRFHGQTLIEFALLLPVLIFLLAGFLDLGRALFYYSSISNMTREGARYGTVDNNPTAGPYTGMVEKINEKSFAISDVHKTPTDTGCYPGPCEFIGPDIVVIITRIGAFDEEGNFMYYDFVKVEAIYTFTPVTPGIRELFSNSTGVDLRAQSTMRLAVPSR